MFSGRLQMPRFVTCLTTRSAARSAARSTCTLSVLPRRLSNTPGHFTDGGSPGAQRLQTAQPGCHAVSTRTRDTQAHARTRQLVSRG